MIEQMDEPGEQLDLVDAGDKPIGVISRQEVLSLEQDGRGFTRAVGVFVVNGAGRLWIPRRQLHKKIAPGGLDFSAGEHVGHGELYEDAALRGLHEELDIIPADNKLTFVGDIRPFAGMPYFHKIYLYHAEEVPTYSTSDYSGFAWLTPQEVADKLAAGEPAKEVLAQGIQLVVRNHVSLGVA